MKVMYFEMHPVVWYAYFIHKLRKNMCAVIHGLQFIEVCFLAIIVILVFFLLLTKSNPDVEEDPGITTNKF